MPRIAEEMRCETCEGEGKHKTVCLKYECNEGDITKICSECDGKKEVSVLQERFWTDKEIMIPCDHCDGSGELIFTCGDCDGGWEEVDCWEKAPHIWNVYICDIDSCESHDPIWENREDDAAAWTNCASHEASHGPQ